jgi:hypothetical protein
MWQATYSTTTDVPAEALFKVMADINHWPLWADDLEYTQLGGDAKPSTPFILKPKGGPKVKLNIERFEPPTHFTDIAHLPLGKMRTSKSFIEVDGQTQFTMTVEVWGVLGFLWRRVIAAEQIKGAPEQCAKMFAYAKTIVAKKVAP